MGLDITFYGERHFQNGRIKTDELFYLRKEYNLDDLVKIYKTGATFGGIYKTELSKEDVNSIIKIIMLDYNANYLTLFRFFLIWLDSGKDHNFKIIYESV